MANRERPEEIEARSLVERETGLRFVHADKNGGVDYVTFDRITASIEVTTVTDQAAKKNNDAARQLLAQPTIAMQLRQCWVVAVEDTHPRFKGLPGRLEPHLAALEAKNVSALWDHQAGMHVLAADSLAVPSRGLLAEKVTHVWAAPELCTGGPQPHEHGIHLSTHGGGTASGSDFALTLIEEALNLRADNFRKLAHAETTETHLFVWLDFDTRYEITRPFSGRDLSGDLGHFGLPTRHPELVSPVQHLWIVHRGSGRGWHWDGVAWSAVGAWSDSRPLPSDERRSSPTQLRV